MEHATLYYDGEQKSGTVPLFHSSCPVLPAGKHITPSYPDCAVTAIDHILREQYDFFLHFHQDLPQFSFYPVPALTIFAIDSLGGSFVSTANSVSIAEEDAPIYYLNAARRLVYLAPNLRGLLSLLLFVPDWKHQLHLTPSPLPVADEKGRKHLIAVFKLSPAALPETAPAQQIQLFPSLAAAKELLPFIELN